MDIKEAKSSVEQQWKAASEIGMGCSVFIDDALTEEYPWGWVFYISAVEPEKCKKRYHVERVACDRESGISIPVGTKGLKYSLGWIADLKQTGDGNS